MDQNEYVGSTAEFLPGLLRRLTNLSSGNRMVYLPRLSAARHLDLTRLAHLEGKDPFSLLSALLRRQPVRICPVHDPRLADANEVSLKLQKLDRLVRMIFEETGARDLHVAWLFAHGKFLGGAPVRAPLLLMPVELAREDGHWVLKPSQDGVISFNKSLLHAYAHHQQIEFPVALAEEDFDDIDREPTAFLSLLYEMLQRSHFEVNFNRDNFRDELVPFHDFRKQEFDEAHQDGELKLFPAAVLGVFPQSDSYLEPDYHQMIASGAYQDADAFFHALVPPFAELAIHSESRMIAVFPEDPWQEQAIRAVKQGNSLVVQGPPGTGKSQLICNLISDAIAGKRNILVVSQKRAALDVIWKRMVPTGLANFMALVHDFREDRRSIYARIAGQIAELDEYRRQNNSLDAIQLERSFLQACNRIDHLVEKLGEFRTALADETLCGISIKELYMTAQRDQPVVQLRQELHAFRMDQLDEYLFRLRTLTEHRQVLARDGGHWDHRRSFAGFGHPEFRMYADLLSGFHERIARLSAPLEAETGSPVDFFQFCIFREALGPMREVLTLLREEDHEFLRRLFEEVQETPSDLWVANLQRLALACFDGEGVEVSLSIDQLGPFQQALSRAMRARTNIFSWIRWSLFSNDNFLISRALVANGLSGREGLRTLERKLDNRLNLEHQLSKLQEKEWTTSLPRPYSHEKLEAWFESTRRSIGVRNRILAVRSLVNFLSPETVTTADLRHRLELVIRQTEEFCADHDRWTEWFTLRQLHEIGADPVHTSVVMHYLERHFDRMCAADAMVASFTEAEKIVSDRLAENLPEGGPDQVAELFLNSVRLGWIEQLEARMPELRIVSSGVIEQYEHELRQMVSAKRRLSRDIALLRARERMTDDVAYNRMHNLVTYRDLNHQVTKRKRLWPLRRTISEFSNELFRVIPCWLASPESVSALFPLERHFDLVIFDEASQCFPEQGLPAIARGKQVVVAGDDKQLRPSDFYRLRWESAEDDPDLEAESLLELTGRRFPHVRLQGHYRSRYPELIAFSNRYFYGGRLVMIPDRHHLQHRPDAFEYVRVNGIWEDQHNAVEADAIAAMVLERTKSDPAWEVGVITFNQPQQERITDTIENVFRDAGIPVPASLMVKNIENVQGDEKDLIIFSVGYAPARNNRVMLQFGSLNQEGGENRLNVAVTRARMKVVVVTSIDPEQLRTDEVKNDGPRMLRAYLEFVRDRASGVALPPEVMPRTKRTDWYLSEKILADPDNTLKMIVRPFPFADLATAEAGFADQVILTDDDQYLQSPTPKLHHALLGELLEARHWSWRKVYSRNFWLDRSGFMENLKRRFASRSENSLPVD